MTMVTIAEDLENGHDPLFMVLETLRHYLGVHSSLSTLAADRDEKRKQRQEKGGP